MNDQIKTISLAIIAIAMIVQTFLQLASMNNGETIITSSAANDQSQVASIANENTPVNPSAESQSDVPKTTIQFEKQEHNFGTLKEGEKVTYDFNFINSGSNPLTISNAKGSCGCTVPEWPREPIPPGKKGKITVSYDSKSRSGSQEKTVTITANTEPQITQLKIKAMVTQEAQLEGEQKSTTKK